ncbi:two-partner secretion domain-containing protein [Microcoleus sp. D2_18a_D3]|uniref:two-partner secretion domain-containing protein n=1 Tax=Microcoleus sp. D2_18a_D3 TaxID=3055330 RepID=UPI002FCFF347
MRRQSNALFFAFLLLCPFPAVAQIIPDNSLGAESSRTVPATIKNLPSDSIEGGATRGVNLFHSFQQFNVGEGRGAYFANPNGIVNIFTRVTGGNPSNILGVLGVQGNANLFLLNPKGIIFGPNARLDLSGSFLASSADSVVFDNGYQFSSSNPQSVPLLNVNIPIGLNFRENPGKIINNSAAQALNLPELPPGIPPIFNNMGLGVAPGQTLALVGGNIELNQGIVTASAGQILLGSVASPGLVGFGVTPLGLSLNYDKISNFGNIQLTNNSLINSSGLGGGRVEIRGGNIALSGSLIYSLTLGNLDGKNIDINAQNFRAEGGSQIFTLALGDGAAGAVNIFATDSVQFIGIGFESYKQFVSNSTVSGEVNPFDRQILLITSNSGSGNAGDITITTPDLVLRDGVVAGASSFGAGNSGNIAIRSQTVDIDASTVNNGSLAVGAGAGGNITVDTQRLTVRDGGNLSSSTYSQKASGNITVRASESVEIIRTVPGVMTLTAIGTNSIGSSGRAGDITIDTKRLIVSEGAGITSASGTVIGNTVSSATGGPGGNLTIRAAESVEVTGASEMLDDGQRFPSFLSAQTTTASRGGEIRISTPMLTVRDGGIISAASLGAADAGDITINASRVEVQGMGNNNGFSSRIEASAGRFSTIFNPNTTGNAGSLNLNVNRLSIRDGATVDVQSLGTGRAGNINVVANSINLDTKGSIDGTNVSGTGANINLQARDIQLRRGSRITTDAGISEGGNIRINSDILVALPRENSDITANARTARGGQVTVNVPNIFGFSAVTREQARSSLGLTDAEFAALQVNPTSLVPTSDIAAISQSSGPALQGTVTFSSSGVNPAQGLVELPQNVVDPTALIAANPCTQEAGSAFTVTGKGGVPPSPNDALSSPLSPLPWVEEAGRNATSNVEDLTTDVTDRGKKEEGEIPDREVVPAQGWVVNAKGEVMLVGYNPGNAADSRNPRLSSGCVPR